MYEIILESLALPQYTKIPCENKKCSYILIVLLEVLRWPFETKPQNSYIAMSTGLLNSISSRICRQNTQFNMYTTTSKQQEGCTFKDSHPKCFITTNFDKFHREAFARGGESR